MFLYVIGQLHSVIDRIICNICIFKKLQLTLCACKGICGSLEKMPNVKSLVIYCGLHRSDKR